MPRKKSDAVTPPPSGGQYRHDMPIKDLVPSKDNPRRISKKDPKMLELRDSIKSMGVLEPVLARPMKGKPGKYDMRAGERRWVAAQLAGMAVIPCIVREMTDQEAFEVTVLENLQRDDLTPLEEARGVQAMLDKNWEPETIAAQLGKSPSWVARRARLTKLTEKWRKATSNPDLPVSRLPAGHLELIARLPAGTQDMLFKEMRAGEVYTRLNGSGSREELEKSIDRHLFRLKSARWKLTDEKLLSRAGSCEACNKRSGCQPMLFEGLDPTATAGKKNDQCLDPGCWNKKLKAFTLAKHKQLTERHGKVLLERGWGPGEMFVDGPTVHDWDYDRAKKSDKDAIPLLTVKGENAGQVRYVKPKKGAKRAQRGTTKRKDAPSKGNVWERRGFAMDFANAQLCMTYADTCFGPHDNIAVSLEEQEKVKAMALDALVNGYGPGFSRSNAARNWLIKVLQLDLKPAKLLQRYNSADVTQLFVALGLFDYIQHNTNRSFRRGFPRRPFTFPKHTCKEAAEAFLPPDNFIELHRKSDLYIMGKQLNAPVKSSMKTGDLKNLLKKAMGILRKVMDGQLTEAPAGFEDLEALTQELTEAFGLKWKKASPPAKKKAAPRAKKKSPGRPRKKVRRKKAS